MVLREQISIALAQISTAIGLRKAGFFIPYRHAGSVSSSVPAYGGVEELFDRQSGGYREIVNSFSETLPDLRVAVADGEIPIEDRGMFPTLDAVIAYHLVRKIQPKRIVEIGSGASTHVMSRAVRDNGTGEVVCIDPQPRRSIENTNARIHKRVLTYDDVALLDEFESDDVLFIDSSHIMLPGTDVDIQFNCMFPRLPVGAIVHVHDIFLPEGYPSGWERRSFSEQNALIGWIMSGYFEVIYPSQYVATRLEKDLQAVLGELMPEGRKKSAGSIWLRRAGSAG